MKIQKKYSPNFNKGRKGYEIEAIVIHIMAGSLDATDDWFSNPKSKVSAHYGVGFNGEIHQYVQDEDMSWANGYIKNPSWNLIKRKVNPNLYTLSIENEGNNLSKDITPKQKTSLTNLIAFLCQKYDIPVDRNHIIGHREINSFNKPNCPAPAESMGIVDEIVGVVEQRLANL